MNKKWLCVSLAALLLLTSFILYNAGKSSESSHEDTFIVEDILLQDTQIVPPHKLHYTVRKAAHLFEYALLGAVVAWTLTQLRKKWGGAVYGFGLFYLLAVGVLDEYVQSFSGRSSLLSDVLLDFVGGMLGLGLVAGVCILALFCKRIKRKTCGGLSE